MKKEKLSLKSIKKVLSRAELKKIMAGSGGDGCPSCHVDGDCYFQPAQCSACSGGWCQGDF